jgi:hypothetical protein
MNEGGRDEPAGEITPRARLRRAQGIAWRIVEGEAILVNARKDEVIQLDPVGAFIWSRLNGQLSLEEVAHAVVEEFEVTQEKATEDILEFAGRLLEQGVVDFVDLE